MMPRRRVVRLPILLSILLAACAGGGEPEPVIPDLAFPPAVGDDYAFDFQRECFCIEEAREPVRITVRDRVVAEVRSRRTGELLATEGWPTLAELFREVDSARAAGEDVVIERDSVQVPTRIQIGNLAADAGMIYLLGSLQPLD